MSHKILFTFVRVHLGSDKVQILAGIASVPVESSFLNLPCLTSLQTIRSLLLVILSTLVVLSATTGAISLNTRKLATVTDSKYVSTFPIRSLLAGHNVIKKRSLRSDDSNAIMEKLGNDAEERALTVSKLLDKLEKFIYGFRVGFSPKTQSPRKEEKLFSELVELGKTPKNIKSEKLDKKGIIADRFIAWYGKLMGWTR